MNYEEEYVINCVTLLFEFLNNYGSITDERKSTTRTDQTANPQQANNQIEARHAQKLQTSSSKRNNRSSLLPVQSSIYTFYIYVFYIEILVTRITIYHYKKKEMDIKTVENFELEDPSEETLALTKRWREITLPGDYTYTQ